MNCVLFEPHEIDSSGQLVLGDQRAQHVQKVLKAQVGDKVRVGELNGPISLALVCRLTDQEVSLQVQDSTGSRTQVRQPPGPSPIDLILALPRPKAFGRMLESITELGIKRIYITQAAKVEKSYWDAHQLSTKEIEKHLRMGLSQCVDTMLPKITFHQRFRPFVEDELPAVTKDQIKILAHPSGEKSLRQISMPPNVEPGKQSQKISLAIGPEGGWVDFEVNLFRELGYLPLSISERILSSETAAPAIISALTTYSKWACPE